MLTITLDESDCFAAWVSAKDAGFSSSDGSDPKCETSDSIPFLCAKKNKTLLNNAELKLTVYRITTSGLTVIALVIFVVNLGGLLLQALLEFWPRTRINPMDEEENEVNHGKDVVLCQI